LTCAANRVFDPLTQLCNKPTDSIEYLYTPYCNTCEVAVVKAYFSDDLKSILVKFEINIAIKFDSLIDPL